MRHSHMLWPRVLLALLVTLTLTTLPAPAAAATLTVTASGDNGPGTLRDTIAAADPGDTISFAPGVTDVTLTTEQLTLFRKDLTIDGGAAGVTIRRSADSDTPEFGIFNFFDSAVSLNHLTIQGGTMSSLYSGGGGLSMAGGTLTLTDSTISGNTAYHGGGLNFADGAKATLINTTINGNTAYSGGGIYIYVRSSVTLINSTVSGNSASYGGGLLVIGNVTQGHAIVSGGRVMLTNSTVSDNSAISGGGLAVGGYATLVGTIVAGATTCSAGVSNITDNGYNLDSGTSCGFTQASSRSNIDPQLGPLADNGGPNWTHLPAPQSPARDRIGAAACAALPNGAGTRDQRGIARPQGPRCDSGAVEVVPASAPTDPGFADVPPSNPAYAAIAGLVEWGIIKGYATTPPTFGPQDLVQRTQMAAMIVRALQWQERPATPRTFSDLRNSNDELQRAALILANACGSQGQCVAQGYANGNFGRFDDVSHAQVVALVARAFGLDPTHAWAAQAGGAPYAGVPVTFLDEVATYHANAGPIPDAPTTPEGWDAPADRAWVAQVLYLALQTAP